MSLHPIVRAHMGITDFLDEVGEAEPRPSLRSLPIQGTTQADVIQNEKSWHRLVCYRSACGDTPSEIAKALDVSVAQVRNVLNQPRSRQMIAEILRENFDDDIGALLAGGAVEAVLEMRRLVTEGKDEKVRVAAAKDIMDRAFGTPKQMLTREERKAQTLTPEEEEREIQKEIEQLEAAEVPQVDLDEKRVADDEFPLN